MTTSRSPLRLDADLVASATAAASSVSRSTAQQIAHWARIGREIEQSPDLSAKDVAEVLRGAARYDSLSAREQALVRASWTERMRSLLDELASDGPFEAAGSRYAELDAEGNVVVRSRSESGGDPVRPTNTQGR